MSLLKQFGTDSAKENNGVEFELGENEHNGQPMKVLLARRSMSNKRYKKAVDRFTKPYRRQIETDTLPAEKNNEIQVQIFAEACLLSWQNIPLSDITGNQEDKAKIAEYNTDNVVKMLLKIPELFSMLSLQATTMDLYKLDIEDDAKN